MYVPSFHAIYVIYLPHDSIVHQECVVYQSSDDEQTIPGYLLENENLLRAIRFSTHRYFMKASSMSFNSHRCFSCVTLPGNKYIIGSNDSRRFFNPPISNPMSHESLYSMSIVLQNFCVHVESSFFFSWCEKIDCYKLGKLLPTNGTFCGEFRQNVTKFSKLNVRFEL